MRIAGLAVSASLSALVLACAGEGDVPGPAVLETWQLEEEVRVGGGDAPLTRLGTLLPTAEGGLWVLQPADRNIRVYGPDGTLVRRVGGPDDFTLPSRMGWWGTGMDTVWVSDLGIRRVNLFTTGGELAASLDMPFVAHQEVFTVNQPTALLADASAVALAGYASGETDWEGGFPLLRYSLVAGRVIGEIARLSKSTSVVIRQGDEVVSTGVHPIPDAPLLAFSPDGTRIVIVDRTVGDPAALGTLQVDALGVDGDTLWSRRYPYDPEPLPAAEAEALLAPRIASLQQFARLDGSLSEEEAEQAYRSSVVVPAHRPPVQAAHLGADGWIWLEWSAGPEGAERWWVLSPDGTPVADLTHLNSLDVRAVGHGWVWAVETDAGGATHIVRYRAGAAP